MLRPTHLPQTRADLQTWRVWADALLERADPLGELLAVELATTLDAPRFAKLAARQCEAPEGVEVGWCLGHARSVRVTRPAQEPMTKRMMPPLPDAAQLDALAVFMASPAAALLEDVEVTLVPDLVPSLVKALKAAPASCTTVALDLWGGWAPSDCERLITQLPAKVRRVALLQGDAAPFATRRFDELDLRRYTEDWVRFRDGKAIVLRRTRELAPLPAEGWPHLVIGDVADARHIPLDLHPGAPGDAALLDPTQCHLRLIPRPSLVELQQHVGIVSATAWLARAVPEDYARDFRGRMVLTPRRPAQLTRHPDGRWTIGPDGAPLTSGQSVALGPGAALVFIEDAADFRRFV